ncbi:MAG: aldose 1-epimerase family protein [Kiritimatiellae bacterium]|nr:aldose 1-epimerase family protein [Kiritimatiellia bacterium]
MKAHDHKYLSPRVGRMAQLASIRRLVADDGMGRGMRALEVNNGSGLAFTVYPDRALDIGQAYFKGIPIAWIAAGGEAAPQFYNESGLGWLRTFGGGLLTGCGLTNVGSPCTADGEAHGLHGRLSHLIAEDVNTASEWSQDTYRLTIRGCVRQSRVFGENLTLARELSTAYGENCITVRDVVENRGFRPSPFMLLYHLNLGWPLVDEGATIEMSPHEVVPRDDHAATGVREWSQFSAPVPGYAERVFYHSLPPDAQGLASARLANPKLGIALRVSYRLAELPYLIQWRMMGQGEYVLGLEPANCYPEGQVNIAKRGLLRHLAPGEKTETCLRLSFENLK